MGFMDGLASAFANDESLGERKEAGLAKKKTKKTVTWRGQEPGNPSPKITTTEVIAGQRLMDVVRDAGVQVRSSCMNGSCGICNVKVDGNTVPLCITKAPDKDITIDYVDKSGKRAAAKKVPKGKVVPIPGKEGEAVPPEKPRLTQASLEERLRAEMEAKKAAKKAEAAKSPFGGFR
jgi:ferredoxin